MTSEFGKGLCYCLGLFLTHEGKIKRWLECYKKIDSNKNRAYEMWFYASADHLFELQWQSAPNKSLQNRCKKFQHKCLSLRLPMGNQRKATEADFNWAIQEAKDLLRLIDKANGVKTLKGDWE